ncbi:flagellar biosynthetic protein FliO [Domibacillus enclensis]|uniref:Flagellar protein FliO/FliZ n=1 Tax=Domibacillus enclensis TaxID=1017273 RepID=A0A1N6ULJ9_9BACI|nr:flagellar biosynthetic protein FliO [Domibacillus enclensis]OXS78560.1 hypothetical protein B1B05_08145 [Domibacillus enclensis]SIQ66490.1 flagellar protein FliO/FliZ [Domibacillus enclensis]
MKFLYTCILSFLVMLSVLSGNATIAGAALSQNSSVSDCVQQPDLCSQEEVQTESEGADSGSADERDSVGIGFLDIVRMIAALAFVVALLYFLLRFVNKKSRSFQDTNVVRHLGGTALGGSRSVQIVKVGDSVFVLGVGEDISLIKEIEDPAERQALLSRYDEQAEAFFQPADVVGKIVSRFGKKDEPAEPAVFKQEFERKINELKKSREKALKDATDRERNEHE